MIKTETANLKDFDYLSQMLTHLKTEKGQEEIEILNKDSLLIFYDYRDNKFTNASAIGRTAFRTEAGNQVETTMRRFKKLGTEYFQGVMKIKTQAGRINRAKRMEWSFDSLNGTEKEILLQEVLEHNFNDSWAPIKIDLTEDNKKYIKSLLTNYDKNNSNAKSITNLPYLNLLKEITPDDFIKLIESDLTLSVLEHSIFKDRSGYPNKRTINFFCDLIDEAMYENDIIFTKMLEFTSIALTKNKNSHYSTGSPVAVFTNNFFQSLKTRIDIDVNVPNYKEARLLDSVLFKAAKRNPYINITININSPEALFEMNSNLLGKISDVEQVTYSPELKEVYELVLEAREKALYNLQLDTNYSNSLEAELEVMQKFKSNPNPTIKSDFEVFKLDMFGKRK